mgnify:CR=1 FL=1
MDYLQYEKIVEVIKKLIKKVLNLIINGLPSIPWIEVCITMNH